MNIVYSEDSLSASGGASTGVQLAVTSFVDELENIFLNTDKVIIRSTEKTIPSECVPESHELLKVYEVLDGKGNPGFLLGRCQESKRTLLFVLYLNSKASGVLRLKSYGIFNQNYEIDGAGILKFRQVRNIFGGYTLEDDWKQLLRITLGYVPLFSCFRDKVTMSFRNMDGTSSGSMSYKAWPELGITEKAFTVHFIPNLDRKAKYMLLASSLVPRQWRTAAVVQPFLLCKSTERLIQLRQECNAGPYFTGTIQKDTVDGYSAYTKKRS